MSNYAFELKIAKQLAKDAGSVMLKYFNSASADPTVKSDRTLVTKADTEINAHIIDVLKKETPGHSIWGEEQSEIIDGAKFTWVCDPVDGTMPFAKGLPISTFSLALVNEDGEGVLGVAYDPFQDRLFEAIKGQGALLNGKSIHVSQKTELSGAFVDEELWLNEQEDVTFDDPRGVLSARGASVTTMCSAVMTGCLVAKGNYEAMVFGQGKPEDIAALAVIVTEAGGKVTDLFGNEQRYDTNIRGAIVSNGAVHDELLEIIRKINYSSKYFTNENSSM